MPLPSPNCSGIEDEVCCEALWTMGNYLLDMVWEPLSTCLRGGTCYGPGLTKYVAFSDASTLCCDTLSVSLDGVGFTTGSAAALQSGIQNTRIGLTTQWRIRLLESCYPMLDDAGTPTPADYNFVNRHLYAHGEMIFRVLQQAHERKALAPGGCASSALRFFRPIPVEGDCVGWEYQVEVVTDWAWVM